MQTQQAILLLMVACLLPEKTHLPGTDASRVITTANFCFLQGNNIPPFIL